MDKSGEVHIVFTGACMYIYISVSCFHSELSLEAERRMLSVYMPDERISMFPEQLASELLSLGASLDSYAVSCGTCNHRCYLSFDY